MIEADKLPITERICSKHTEIINLFCTDCNRELCIQCLDDHEGHKCQRKDKAIEFFVEKCREKEKIVQEKISIIREKQVKVEKIGVDVENKMESYLQKSLDLFNRVESKILEEETSSVTRMMSKREFSFSERKQSKLEKAKQGYQYVQQIIRPIILNPGKNVMEPVLVFELAERTLERAEEVLKCDPIQNQLEKPLSNYIQISKDFLESLQKSLREIISDAREGISVVFTLNYMKF